MIAGAFLINEIIIKAKKRTAKTIKEILVGLRVSWTVISG